MPPSLVRLTVASALCAAAASVMPSLALAQIGSGRQTAQAQTPQPADPGRGDAVKKRADEIAEVAKALTGPAAGTITLDVTPSNDAPTASNLSQTRPYTEDPGGNVALDDYARGTPAGSVSTGGVVSDGPEPRLTKNPW